MSTARLRAERLKLLRHEKRLKRSGYRLIAGVDEAGRGPLAGPVVACAVILKDFDFAARINDSKKLTPKKRETAFREIMEKAIVGIGIVSEKDIDVLNIHKATIKAMEGAIWNLKIPPDCIIVDGKVRIASSCPVTCIVRGDSESLSIAAASIVAKVSRDELMRRFDSQFPRYGFARHKGYPTREHKRALKIHGPSPLHRMSFRPVKDASENKKAE